MPISIGGQALQRTFTPKEVEGYLTSILANLDDKSRLNMFFKLREMVNADLAKSLGVASIYQIRSRSGAQSLAFMVDLLPHIWRHFSTLPRDNAYTWLDVGPGAGYGAGILAAMHSGPALGHRVDVSVLDIRSNFFDFMRVESPCVREYLRGDLYKLDRTFDFASASHVIEHVPNPASFVRRLQEVAHDRVFVLTPWKERREIKARGHCNIFDEAFLGELGNPEHKLLRSAAWGAFLKPPYEMLYLELPGLAPKVSPTALEADHGEPASQVLDY